MKNKIILVNKDKVYFLTDIIPEFMEVENKTFEEAIEFFMKGYNGERYLVVPETTPTHVIVEWIVGEDCLLSDDEIN